MQRHGVQLSVVSSVSQWNNRAMSPMSASFYPASVASGVSTTFLNAERERQKKEEMSLTAQDVAVIFNHYDADGSGVVTKDAFIEWWFSSSANADEFDSAVRSLLFLYGRDFVGQKSDELHAFAQYLNRIFAEKVDNRRYAQSHTRQEVGVLDRYLPIDSGDGGHDILSKLVDGVLLAFMINLAAPGTIDERVMHLRDIKSDAIAPKHIVENLNIVLASCKAIGLSFKQAISVEVFLDPSFYEDIVRHILSELSKRHLSLSINLKANPVLVRLGHAYEDEDMLRSVSSTQWLKRWINYQLKRSGEDSLRIKRFGKQFADGAVLSHVLHAVTKRKKRKMDRFDINRAMEQASYARPGYVLDTLRTQFKLNVFISANDILSGNSRLICLLCAQIFEAFKGMRKITTEEQAQVDAIFGDDEDDDEDREPEPSALAPPPTHFASPSDSETPRKYREGDWDTSKGRTRKRRHRSMHSTSSLSKAASLDLGDTKELEEAEEEDAVQREIREERDTVNWLNEIFASLPVKRRGATDAIKISSMARDLRDGVVLLRWIAAMTPSQSAPLVDEAKVFADEQLSRQQALSNCHYLAALIKAEPLCLCFVDVAAFPSDGAALSERKWLLALCRNLINAHYLWLLQQHPSLTLTAQKRIAVRDVLEWSNERLRTRLRFPRFSAFEERTLKSLRDESLKSCLFFVDLLLLLLDERADLEPLRAHVVHRNNRQLQGRDADYTKAECVANARYALSIARKFGAVFYISPFDLVNVRSEEVTLSLLAVIMLLVLEKERRTGKHRAKANAKGRRSKVEKDSDGDTIDALQSHLAVEAEAAAANEEKEEQRKVKAQGAMAKRKSVLAEYGVITDEAQLSELTELSREYSTPNIGQQKAELPDG